MIILGFTLFVSYNAIYPYNSPEWMGFAPYDEIKNGPEPKKLWDWLDLLIIPDGADLQSVQLRSLVLLVL